MKESLNKLITYLVSHSFPESLSLKILNPPTINLFQKIAAFLFAQVDPNSVVTKENFESVFLYRLSVFGSVSLSICAACLSAFLSVCCCFPLFLLSFFFSPFLSFSWMMIFRFDVSLPSFYLSLGSPLFCFILIFCAFSLLSVCVVVIRSRSAAKR
jgi:hypothetical protein